MTIDNLPPLIAKQLRHDVANKGRRKRLAKDISKMLRSGNTVPLSQVYSTRLEGARTAGEYIPNRATRRGSKADALSSPRGASRHRRIK